MKLQVCPIAVQLLSATRQKVAKAFPRFVALPAASPHKSHTDREWQHVCYDWKRRATARKPDDVVTTREKFSVLILADSATLLKSIGHAVRNAVPDVAIHDAPTLADAQSIIAETRIHFFILENRLPSGSGIDFLCDLRTFSPDARVVMMSDKITPEEEEQLQKLGVLQNFPMPLDVEALARLVQTHHGYMTSGTGILDAKGEFAVSLTCPSALDIIQLKCLASATITLQVSSGHGVGRIYFNHGEIVHAETTSLRGERAFEKILRWKGGRIKEFPLDVIPERTITSDWQGLLLNVAQRIDESLATL